MYNRSAYKLMYILKICKAKSALGKMFMKSYANFVKASSPVGDRLPNNISTISGDEAQRMYLNEVKDSKESPPKKTKSSQHITKKLKQEIAVTNNDVFLIAQSNDVDTLRSVLASCPDKINIVDDYGWSLLMIACQANSVDIVKELLNREIDMSIRDKAGNSAQSLVIKNKNYLLADVLLHHKCSNDAVRQDIAKTSCINFEKQEYSCEICNKTYPDKEEHLSSTLHNISASKGKKIPSSYAIPQTNRGYQIMLRVGWDKDSGLGRDGTGTRYPIKVVKKEDRKGLGHGKRKPEVNTVEDNVRHKTRRKLMKDQHHNKRFEINFRREFY